MTEHWHALDELFTVRGRQLKQYAYLLSGDDTAADDLTQEVLTRALTRRVPHDPQDLERYLRRMMVNLVVDNARRATRWSRLLPRIAVRAEAPDTSGELAERISLEAAVIALPPRQRACVVLHYYEDLPLADIADLLRCGVGTVKSQLHAARATLAKQWSETTREPLHTKGEVG